MRGRSGPAFLLLASAVAVAVVVGSIVGQQLLRARADGTGAGAGGIVASVDGTLAAMPEVWDLTDAGDVLPGGTTTVGPLPEPAAQANAAPGAAGAGNAAAPASSPTLFTRIPKPSVTGPRRVGLQAGHWETEKAPPELWRLLTQTGTAWNGVTEVSINVDIAQRVKAILEPKGIAVDVLPTTIPPGYVADAFVSLHGDGDGTGENSGFKMAFSSRRTPYESALLESIRVHYGAATGLPWDGSRITRNMINYYGLSWQRNKYATAPHTPSVVLEMGYVSHDHDRTLMTEKADLVAGGIAEGIVRFLADHPREKLFGQDLLVPARAQFGTPRPSATPGN